MTKTLDVLMSAVLAVFVLYLFSFAFVGACLVGTAQPVSECRDNIAGRIVYQTVSLFI